ncbi:hypothetical protein BGW36DRAFT_272033, partial [Talaromyces proteolyticus]
KVPIPRFTQRYGSQTSYEKKRVSRACEPCRERKRKCNGERPNCRQCGQSKLACQYSDSKRVRDKALLTRAARYERLLGDLAGNIDKWSKRRIKKALRVRYIPSFLDMPLSLFSCNRDSPDLESSWDESPHSNISSTSSLASSLGALDAVDEDMNRDERSQSTGFIGKNSEISWLEGLKELRDAPPKVRTLNDATLSSVSYHLDEIRLSESDDYGNPYELPPKDLADKLFGAFLDSVGDSFPIIRKTLFSQQMNNLYSQPSTTRPGNRWLAILNIIFAIGGIACQYTQQAQSKLSPKIFFSRAKALSGGENILYEHADLQQVQVESLLAFYFLCSAQINRAWKMVGIATRSAIALGLDLRVSPSSIHPVSMEARIRTWSSIFYLENLLTVMTSRTSCLGDGSSAAYPPLPFEEEMYGLPEVWRLLKDPQYRESCINWTLYQDKEQISEKQKLLGGIEHSSALYFYHLTDLAVTTHAITNRVYSPEIPGDQWVQIERRISLYMEKMDAWLRCLTPPLKFIDQDKLLINTSNSQQVSLALNYFGTRMILTRPCLTGSKDIGGNSKEHEKSFRLSNKYGRVCLQSAEDLISILPDHPDMVWLSKASPWWSILHFIMQAATVLLIYMTIFDEHDAESPNAVISAAKKALSWLHSLSECDESARRAFLICERLLHRIA